MQNFYNTLPDCFILLSEVDGYLTLRTKQILFVDIMAKTDSKMAANVSNALIIADNKV